jgi:uncharacterized protein
MNLLAETLVGLIFALGLVGTLLPVLPGTVIAFGGVFVHRLWLGDASVSWTFVAVCAGLALASIVADWGLTFWGARRFGASRQGAIGAIVGGLAGILLLSPLPGLIFGPLVGAILFEWIEGRSRPEALRAGWGTLVGGTLAFAFKLAATAGIVGGFYLAS